MTRTEPRKPVCISYIRFSTPDQIKGNSLKRQLRKGQEYAEKHGLVIDERFALKDLGISAFRGEHKRRGALGVFLRLVEDGEIPRGSVLLIESFDRLSREKMMESVDIFMRIVRKDIKIVTLIDGKTYDKNSNSSDWISMLSIIGRANEESETKSVRLKDAWAAKREDIAVRKLTARAPAWLKLDKKKQQFQVLPDRAQILRRVFKLYLDGNGAEKISRLFNTERITAWKGDNGWHKSYIQKILHNRAVIGEFQPHTLEGKKRTPLGEPIVHYYPEIISKKDFHKVQERLATTTGKGGRNGSIRNLFGHVATCGYCGAPMQFIDKGRGDRYLICDNARRGLRCDKTRWRYLELEQIFLNTCIELDLKSILPHNHDDINGIIDQIKGNIDILTVELNGIATLRKNLLSMLRTSDDEIFRGEIEKDLKKTISEDRELQAKLDAEKAELEKLTDMDKKADEQRRNVAELIEILKEGQSEEIVNIRQKLRTEIRKLVRKIAVFPNGLKGQVLSLSRLQFEYIDISLSEGFSDQGKIDEYIAITTGSQHRVIAIWFRTGGFREVFHEGDTFHIGFSGDNWHDAIMRVRLDAVQ